MEVIENNPIVNLAGFGAAQDAPAFAPPEAPQLEISGPEKAGILLITLGLELSATIFKFLRRSKARIPSSSESQ
jgi:hypothetical protein